VEVDHGVTTENGVETLVPWPVAGQQVQDVEFDHVAHFRLDAHHARTLAGATLEILAQILLGHGLDPLHGIDAFARTLDRRGVDVGGQYADTAVWHRHRLAQRDGNGVRLFARGAGTA